MYLLDTDTLSHLWQGNQSVKERLLEAEDPDIGITVITKCEILRVRCENLLKAADGPLLLQAQQRLSRTEQLLSELTIIPIDQMSVQQFDRLRTAKKLGKCGRADLLIASIALANSATLVTRNVQHFRQIPNLAIENWVA
jgi:tRNA(fMet)-specific endonuclease VapC